MLNLLQKASFAARTRPSQFISYTRMVLKFQLTGLLCKVLIRSGSNIVLGKNVRLQKLSSLMAEKPSAKISIGQHSIIYENAKIEAYGKGTIEIGECCIIGDLRMYSRSKINIGKRLLCSWNVFIQDFDPHPVSPENRRIQTQQICYNFRPAYSKAPVPEKLEWTFPSADIEIGDDVWLGANVTILKGVKIGNGCIVSTGSVVHRGEYRSNTIISGNPAKVIKQL